MSSPGTDRKMGNALLPSGGEIVCQEHFDTRSYCGVNS